PGTTTAGPWSPPMASSAMRMSFAIPSSDHAPGALGSGGSRRAGTIASSTRKATAPRRLRRAPRRILHPASANRRRLDPDLTVLPQDGEWGDFFLLLLLAR